MNPLLILAGAVLVLVIVARFRQVYPHRALVLVALVPAALSLVLIPAPGFYWWLLGIDGLLLLLAVGDLATVPKRNAFSAQRQTGHIASLRKPHQATLTLSNHSSRSQFVWVRDGVGEELHPTPPEFVLRLPAHSRWAVHYEIRPDRRGKFVLGPVYFRGRSRLGLWRRYLTYPCPGEINVYPDMRQLAEYAVLARTNRLSLLGVRRTRKIGQDNEFERLRDYTLDDNYKFIDWRSTARRNKLTVKDFQANQSQRILFLIDCGRMMTNQASGLSLLDHALNAMLMLSYVALRQGDQVGLLTFSDSIHGYVPPRGGLRRMNTLLHTSFNLLPQMVESRYDQAFLYLASHCRKRALVVLITNVIDEVNAHQIHQYLCNLVGRHLPLGVLLRDHSLFEAVDVPAYQETMQAEPRLYRAAAAAEILSWRHQVLTDLGRKGVLLLDVFPEAMTAPLVNRYLDIKARHLL